MPNLDSLNLPDAFSSHLKQDEQLRHWAYGVKQSIALFLLVFFGTLILAALIAYKLIGPDGGVSTTLVAFAIVMLIVTPLVPLIRKDYIVGLTDKRLLIVRIKTPLFKSVGNPQNQIDLTEYPLENLPPLKITTGRGISIIKIDNSGIPFWARFQIKGNREQIEAIKTILDKGVV